MFFFFNDTATTEIYTLSLHDALPIWFQGRLQEGRGGVARQVGRFEVARGHGVRVVRRPGRLDGVSPSRWRSEEHTSELQSRQYLVCRLLLEKKKQLVDTHQIARL